MKGQIARTITVVSLAVWLFAGAAYGQYVQQIIKLSAPFEFNVYDKTLPAGDYSAVFVAPSRIYLQDSHGRTLTTILTHPVELRDQNAAAKVEFSVASDGSHVLTRIWPANDRTGYGVPVAQAKALLARTPSQQPSHSVGAGNK
jgi:hypothetical protein